MICYKSLESTKPSDTVLYFSWEFRSPFLKTWATITSLQSFGSSPVSANRWKMSLLAADTSTAQACRVLFGSSSRPAAFRTLM
ncbi:hypothetical protein DPMN_158995 [Dreissena polymorpha]|uniref:Uncharacterized protein n=1 Tax=Dreissena polymorpha TaxID=45954 RepID=A0A9D4EIX5_DREPO|nr:hypothetical protein DPMN_158343 [Dreissena polymorpha]KAH3781169.1 hypothetical protein DPMN_158995 [Dreissena polymorpha]